MSSALDQFERTLVDASRALHHAAHSPTAPEETADPLRSPAHRRPVRKLFNHRRLLVSLVALVIAAGGVAAASSLLFPSQRLANGTVNCFMATHGTASPRDHTLAVGDPNPNGQPPISLCRRFYRLNRYHLNGSTTGPLVADLPLIACQEHPATVGVYVATGQPDQCRQLREKPLPATYAAAAARLRELQRALVALQGGRDCISPSALAQQARAILTRQGFASWRVITPPPNPGKHSAFGYPLPTGTGGTCGDLLIPENPPAPTAPVDIDTHRQTVTVSVTPPRSIGLELNHIYYELDASTYRHCFTAQSARNLVRRAFSSTPLRPRFATVARQPGTHYAPASERLYNDGCVRFETGITGNNNRFIDILFEARGAPALPAGELFPTASSFHP
jgi:hypothetical protein